VQVPLPHLLNVPNAIPELVKWFKEEEATNSPTGPNSLRPIIPGRALSAKSRHFLLDVDRQTAGN
jgi:hypothetical protein